jgi:hypothetical protein
MPRPSYQDCPRSAALGRVGAGGGGPRRSVPRITAALADRDDPPNGRKGPGSTAFRDFAGTGDGDQPNRSQWTIARPNVSVAGPSLS